MSISGWNHTAIDERIYTVDEFDSLQEQYPDRRFELINGRIVERVTNEEHGAIAAYLSYLLISWKIANNIHEIVSADTSHRVPGDTKNHRRPDISMRLTDSPEPASNEAFLLGISTLAVEIKSPTNTLDELREKARFYLDNGSKLVWLILPESRTIEVITADTTQTLTEGNSLSISVRRNSPL